MYDSRVGVWLSEDPIGLAAADWNDARYVGNDTTNGSDPTGLDKWYYDPGDPHANSNIRNPELIKRNQAAIRDIYRRIQLEMLRDRLLAAERDRQNAVKAINSGIVKVHDTSGALTGSPAKFTVTKAGDGRWIVWDVTDWGSGGLPDTMDGRKLPKYILGALRQYYPAHWTLDEVLQRHRDLVAYSDGWTIGVDVASVVPLTGTASRIAEALELWDRDREKAYERLAIGGVQFVGDLLIVGRFIYTRAGRLSGSGGKAEALPSTSAGTPIESVPAIVSEQGQVLPAGFEFHSADAKFIYAMKDGRLTALLGWSVWLSRVSGELLLTPPESHM
jgi:hypothetical protein